jgi:hypothetical protein
VFALETLPRPVSTGAISVTRWRRFRHDRAYVQVHGVHVGYRDLLTGEIHAFADEDPELIARVTADLQRSTERETVLR